MDFGVVGFDGVVGSDTNTTSVCLASLASDPGTKQKLYGSGFLKQQRSAAAATTEEEDDWRGLKLVKSDHDFQHRNSLLRSNTTILSDAQQQQQQQQQQMLFFSSPKSESFSLERSSLNATTLPCYFRNAGYNSGSFNGASMHGIFTGAKGPFTPSQWMELEHQALIYKYITANVPVPVNLLIPIRKALESAGLSGFPAGLLRPNTLEWGSFNLGFNNTDPEPGRCRRTDGKKWRCSRDAVADQKYCERHMNRGRHRSRKPVEGQTGHSVAGTTTSTAATATKSVTNASSASASVVSGGGTFSSLAIAHHHQLKNLQPGTSNIPAATTVNRMFQNKENVGEKMQETTGLSILSNSVEVKWKENPFFLPKHQIQFEESSRAEFGLVNTDSLLNPSSQKSSGTLLSCRNYGGFPQHITDRERETQYSLRHFMDEWPKNQSDRTQLSISIPMASSTDFLSSTSSPNNEKVTLSPLRLSHELDPLQMGLGVGSVLNEQTINRRANWIPITWETSMGGPLGEVLHNTNNNTTAAHSSKNSNSSALNLMTEGWDSSPPVGSSPTGVLQKTTTFGSLSNSSAGSSPRAEGGSLCSDLLGATRLNSSSLPAV